MIDLSFEYRRFTIPKEKKSLLGLDAILHTFVGKVLKTLTNPRKLRKQSEIIYTLSLNYADLSDKQLQRKLKDCRKVVRFGKLKTDKQLNEALSYIAEASVRTLKLRPYSVQLMGAVAQYKNFAIQMLPGEGKTITAALSAILMAWMGKPCHVATSNDYLAKRDSIIMSSIYEFCGVSVGHIISDMESDDRKENYLKDVVYTTSKELLADFLRDQMHDTEVTNFNKSLIRGISGKKLSTKRVMRGLYSAIIDEADSVLADEATTPLIISAPSKNEMLRDATMIAKDMSDKLLVDIHYTVNRKFHDIKITDDGNEKLDKLAQDLPPMWSSFARREFLVKQALIAREFYSNNEQYIINEENEIIIVDEKTGRMMPGRSWGSGLHQAVEAKEGVELSNPTETHTRMSFQRYFRLYTNLSGMSGTLQKLEDEFWYIYKLPTIKIPKNVPTTYDLLPYKLYSTIEEKWEAVVENVKEINALGRPILIGTRSIEESFDLSNRLKKHDLEGMVLNALYHEEEAEIVELAGERAKITIATNMAGRGTDIKMEPDVIALGGLHVISTQRFDSKRVDLQLYGRAARQGQPGSVQPILSLDDELFIQLCPKWLHKVLKNSVHTYMGKLLTSLVYSRFQSKSENLSSKMRKKILQKDFSLNEMLSFSLQ
ncbi:MAG: hypothetical protein COB02_17100 [Candidatus Cloacimonadota bacterium]|nr:MAG: hypothetical protein COB02_17100 [Candidatus Cloacimonadota bacterium]